MVSSTLIKKSQIWSLDLMIAILIFLGGLLVFYRYSINMVDIEGEDVNSLVLDAKLISSYLVSAGYPKNWTADNATLIGLTDGETRLIEEKVEQFSDIASSDFGRSRRLLSTTRDYQVFFENKEGGLLNVGGTNIIGKNYSAENPESMIKIERFVFYNSSIIRLVVYVW